MGLISDLHRQAFGLKIYIRIYLRWEDSRNDLRETSKMTYKKHIEILSCIERAYHRVEPGKLDHPSLTASWIEAAYAADQVILSYKNTMIRCAIQPYSSTSSRQFIRTATSYSFSG
jgi:hypothetical protein